MRKFENLAYILKYFRNQKSNRHKSVNDCNAKRGIAVERKRRIGIEEANIGRKFRIELKSRIVRNPDTISTGKDESPRNPKIVQS